MLHQKKDICAFHDVSLFDESAQCEKEAETNLLAAEFLVEDGDALYALNDDEIFFAAAASLGVPKELLDFKFIVMKWKSYKLIEPPITAKSNFLRDIGIPQSDGYEC